jgi:uncharacterized protein (DUF488 family)
MTGSARDPIYTIGHSNGTLDGFLDLLEARQITALVDVRSRPFSAYAAQFNQPDLQPAVEARGIRYLFMGRELGGRPAGEEYYDEDGYVLYAKVAQAGFFLSGITRLERGMTQFRVALMCSEEDPTDCHRRRLIARVLAARGVAVLHIRGSGATQTEDDLRRAQGGPPPELQPALFDLGEVEAWKSIRSVLRRKGPPPSSGS